jgi:hypothetical protein
MEEKPENAAASFHRCVRRLEHSPSPHVTILQFNVLAGDFPPKPANDSDVAKAVIAFENRAPLNVSHVEALLPTIVVLEELDCDDTVYALQLASRGYGAIVAKKQGGTVTAAGIFYMLDRVELKSHRIVQFGPSDRPASQFAILSHFKPKDSTLDFVVVATHMKAGRTEENEAIRLAHARQLVLAELPRYLEDEVTPHHASLSSNDRTFKRILWAGDFNAGPHTYGCAYPCALVPWLTNSSARGTEGGFVFESAMANALVGERSLSNASTRANKDTRLPLTSQPQLGADEDLLFTTCKLRDGKLLLQTIDYILYPRGAARCIGWLPCPSSNPSADLAPLYLPNEYWGSDHLSVYAEVVWT